MNQSESDDVGDSRARQVYPLSVGRFWRPSLSLLGVKRSDAYASLSGDAVEIRIGRYFHAHIPLSAITLARAGTGNRVCHFGVCVRQADRVALVANSHSAVEVALSGPQQGKLLGRPVSFSSLAISLEQAEDFLEQVHHLLRPPEAEGVA